MRSGAPTISIELAPPSRTCTTNRPEETKYIYTDDDSQGKQLSGQNNYSIKFAKGEVPPVHGFWSLTLYDAAHLFYPKGLNRYSLGTNNADGSLTLYAGSKDKESNWLPAPKLSFPKIPSDPDSHRKTESSHH